MSRADRMKQAREEAGYKKSAVARILGVSRSAVSTWETDKPRTINPSPANLIKCAKLYKKDIRWLMLGDSFLENNDVIWQASAEKNEQQGMRLVYIPVISWELAKKGKLAVSLLSPDHKEFVPIVTDQDVTYAFALHIKNDSMTNNTSDVSFNMADFIAVNPDIVTIQPEKFGLFLENKDTPIPIFRQLLVDGKTTYLKALNNSYKMLEVTPDTQTIGKIIGRFTPI